MKNMFPILSAAALLLVAAVLAADTSTQVVSQKRLESHPSTTGRSSELPGPAGTVCGKELLDQAVQQLLVLPGIEAKTRQRVQMFGQELVGAGSYLQLARGPRLLLRLDLKLQVAEQVASLLQVSDGDFLWIRRDLPQQRSLGRVDLRKLRTAAGNAEVPVPVAYWMALGGMPQLLVRLNEYFLFSSPQATQIGDLPVWQLDGRWRPDPLAKMLPHRREAILAGEDVSLEELPPHQPHGVTLILGRDEVIPLFPYGVSFYRNEWTGKGQGRAVARRPLVTWELFEVRFRADLTPADFDYRPGNQEIEEQTEQFVARLNAVTQRSGR